MYQDDDDKQRAVLVAEQLKRTALAAERESRIQAEMATCSMCIEYAGRMAPSHRGSTFCRCGSIASGGTKSHCTCDTCF